MLGTISQFTGILGVTYYEKYLKDVEVRTLILYGTIWSVFGAFADYFFALRLNLEIGIPDTAFIVITSLVFGVISLAFSTLPTLALIAKITPKGIEGTIFAFLTSTTNVAGGVIAPLIGY